MALLTRGWRFWAVGFVLVIAMMVVAACEDEEGGGDETPSGSPAAEQVLRVQSLEPQFLDPQRSNFEQDIMIQRMLFRGLYTLVATDDGGVEAQPAMAAGDPEVSDDGLTFTIDLNPDNKWSDGETVTAQHVVDGIRRGCDPRNASPYAYLLQSSAIGGIIGVVGCDELSAALGTAEAPLKPTEAELQALIEGIGAKAIDEDTVEITLVAPKLVSTFKQIFSLWTTFPARQDVIDQFGDKWVDPANIVTNGPYTLSEFVVKDHATLVPNPNYALEPKAQLSELTIHFIDDYSVAFKDYQNGELDITSFPETDIPTVEGDAELNAEYVKEGTARIDAIEMQLENEVLAKFEVRLALSRAIDRVTLNEVVYNGASIPATYWMVEGLPGFQGNEPFEDIIGFDEEAAKQALSDAGYPNGAGFPTLTLLMRDDTVQRALGEYLQNQWKTVLNIDVDLEYVDAATRSARFNAETFELFRGGWQLDYPDPENPIVGLFDTGGGNNHYNCSDPEIDAKINEGLTAETFEDHVKAFQEAEILIVTRLCGVAPITQLARIFLVDSKVGGVIPNGTIDAGLPGSWCAECWFVQD